MPIEIKELTVRVNTSDDHASEILRLNENFVQPSTPAPRSGGSDAFEVMGEDLLVRNVESANVLWHTNTFGAGAPPGTQSKMVTGNGLSTLGEDTLIADTAWGT